VAQEIARRLGDRVRLRWPVVAVEHDERGATVRCVDGEAVEAAAVVVAIPVPLLRELDLRPALPAPTVAALERTLFGDAAKLHVPLAAAPRPGRMASPSALWWCWTSASPSSDAAAPVLSCFAGGAEAIAAVGAGEGPDSWAAQALALRPDVSPAGGAFVTHWGAEPWTRGSYSAPAIGFTPEDDAALVARWGSVVLAGEHTAGAASASMNGAAASGARAAATILDLLRH
jgi:monoamine oxidase